MLTPDSLVTPPGWYGKLPALGDFAQRRLPHDFVEAWDHWLAEGLARWQAEDPAWLDRYLSGPSWRFVLAPGVLGASSGDAAWAGVLIPSCDRVGRYFPLGIARPLTALPASDLNAQGLLDGLLRLDDLALDALEEDWPVDQFEAELARVASLTQAAEQTTEQASPLAAQVLSLEQGQSMWICYGPEGQPVVHLHQGLPDLRGLF